MSELDDLGRKHRTDKATHHGYMKSTYYPLFKNKKKEKIAILEIGAGRFGGSVKVWKEFFENGEVYLFDPFFIEGSDKVGPYSASLEDIEPLGIKCIKGNQLIRQDLEQVESMCPGGLDYIIDDGAHVNDAIQISLATLFKYLKPGGLYIVEDLHTARSRLFNRANRGLLDNENIKIENKTLHVDEEHLIDSLSHFKENNKWLSKTLTDDEKEYLEQNIEDFKVGPGRKICVIIKRGNKQ